MFYKNVTVSLKATDIELLDEHLIKHASLSLPSDVKYDPEFLYVLVRAVSGCEYWGDNKNADGFPSAELVASHKTFLTAHVFKNHNNKDVAAAIGDVLNSEWDDAMKTVLLLIRIDRKVAPTIVRGFQKGTITDVSMGCRVNHTICSICGNRASTPKQYCDHIKFQRGKILDDGRKVYEINIGPKFHDISVVNNGAEKGAKALIIYGDEPIEKQASTLSGEIEKLAGSQQMSDIYTPELPFSMKQMTKEAFERKVASIKKRIQSEVLTSAAGDELSKKLENINTLRAVFRVMYEKYWDSNKCKEIAEHLKMLSDNGGDSAESIFDQFLKICTVCGIELSPREFTEIAEQIFCSTKPTRMSCVKRDIDPCTLMDKVDSIVNNNADIPYDTGSVCHQVYKNLLPNMDTLSTKLKSVPPSDRPKVVKVIISRSAPAIQGSNVDFNDDLMQYVTSNLISRSLHPKVLSSRIGEASPRVSEFSPIIQSNSGSSGDIANLLRSIAYSAYQNDRVKLAESEMMMRGMEKVAELVSEPTSLIDSFTKEAKSKGISRTKALVAGAPIVFGYSAIQRSRMKNGENVSSANRYVAENPANAYLLQGMMLPPVSKKFVDQADKLKGKASNFKGKAMNIGKKMAKKASDTEAEKDWDMFSSEDINSKLLETYTVEQIDAIKKALFYSKTDRHDLMSDELNSAGLKESDIDKYLQICSHCIKMKLNDFINTSDNLPDDNLIHKLAALTKVSKCL